ncbi:cellulase-domain-containing protein [Thozetella sp. PMI_491]|nr:cellulase-domain-containing protein [Thozetella sp. PMI_491]
MSLTRTVETRSVPSHAGYLGTEPTSLPSSATSLSTSALSPSSPSSGTQFAGVNMAGFDFGCGTDGTCSLSGATPPLTTYKNGKDGLGQMQHFSKDDNMNLFRLPVSWQFLVNNQLGGALDATNFAVYDQLVQGCLATGAYCILDLHNYARWNGQIIGQGGPTNAQFADLWSQVAKKYASQPRIWFSLMNEPHDLTFATWVDTLQAAVTAIRNTGATTQYISLPGTQYQSGGSLSSDGTGAALAKVKNPDGSTTGLVFDIHKYYDSTSSGTSTECTANGIDTYTKLATWLRSQGRQAIVSETGGGNTDSCKAYICQAIDYLNQNSDVFLGYVGWAAGSFSPTYALTETPTFDGSTWSDTALVAACMKR